MALEQKGLVKLVEECGEVIQIASKKMARMDSDEHWDGNGFISERIEDEIGDLLAAVQIVIENFDLNSDKINIRKGRKLLLFRQWMTEDTQ